MIEFIYLLMVIPLGSALFCFIVFFAFLNLGLFPSPPTGHWTERLRIVSHARQKSSQQASGRTSKPEDAPEPKHNIRLLDLDVEVERIAKLIRDLSGGSADVTSIAESGLTRVKADPIALESALVRIGMIALMVARRRSRLTIEAKHLKSDSEIVRVHPDVLPGTYIVLWVTRPGTKIAEDEASWRFSQDWYGPEKTQEMAEARLSQLRSMVKEWRGYMVFRPSGDREFEIYLPQTTQVRHKLP
jgi:hypothetical protein